MTNALATSHIDAEAPTESASVGRIGPNAIIQTLRALEERYGTARTAKFLRRGQAPWLSMRPGEMLPESVFFALVRSIVDEFGPGATGSLLQRSGEMTADYVIAYRIPKTVKPLFRYLPSALASRLLLRAVAQNAGTFGESGSFCYSIGPSIRITIANAALSADPDVAAAVCRYDRGAFERLFRKLIDDGAVFSHDRCQAEGAPHCSYRLERIAR